MNTRHFRQIAGWAMVALLICGACSTDDGISEYQRTEAAFKQELGSDVSSLQWWKTAVTLKVTVQAEEETTLWALSEESLMAPYTTWPLSTEAGQHV